MDNPTRVITDDALNIRLAYQGRTQGESGTSTLPSVLSACRNSQMTKLPPVDLNDGLKGTLVAYY